MSDPRFVHQVRSVTLKGDERERPSADLDALTQGSREVAVAAAAALLHLDDTDWIALAVTAIVLFATAPSRAGRDEPGPLAGGPLLRSNP